MLGVRVMIEETRVAPIVAGDRAPVRRLRPVMEPAFYGTLESRKRSGFIYLVRNRKAYQGWCKLGHTEDFRERMDKYRSDMPPPYRAEWEVLGLWQVQYPDLAEAYLLDKIRLGKHGASEWYRSAPTPGRIERLLVKEPAFKMRAIDFILGLSG
jgi:hypothetical protein